MGSDSRSAGVAFAAAFLIATFSPTIVGGEEGPHAHDHDHDAHVDEEIVITVSPLAHERDELAVSFEKLDREEVLERASSTLGETVAGLPGVATSGFAAGASRPVIRGQDAFRTGVVEDGLGTGDVSTLSPDHGVPINPLVAKSIEVVRGPATLRYGGGAIAGVVNTLTGRVPRQSPEALVTGDVFGAWGSSSNESQLAFVLDGEVGPIAWHADGLSHDTNDYDIPGGGNQPNSFVDATAFSGGAAYVHERGRVGFAYSRYDNQYGIPEEGEDVEVDLWVNRYRVEGDLLDPLPGIRELRARFAYSDYQHDEIAAGVEGQSFENGEVEGRVELLHAPLARLHGAAGFHFRRRDEKFRGEAAEFLAPAETLTFAGYLFEEFSPIDHVDLQMGLRVESTSVDGTPAGIGAANRERDFLPLSGSLAVYYHPSDWFSAGLTGSVAQRAPSAAELFAMGAHEATSTFELGDPDLDEETSYTGELVLRVDRDGLRGEVASFVTQYDDYIAGELLGLQVGGLDALVYRSRDVLFYGGEASLEFDLLDVSGGQLGLDAQFDWVRARSSAGRDNLPRITPMRWGAGLFYRGDVWKGRVGFLRHERVDRTGFDEDETDGFVMVEADLSVRLDVFDDRARLELFVNGRNLANERARNHVAFNKDEVLAPAARVKIGLRGSF